MRPRTTLPSESISDSLSIMRKDQLKQISLWVAAIIVISGMVYGFSILASKAAQKKSLGTPLSQPVAADEWVKGNVQAATTLVEYSDYACPTCVTFNPIVKEVLRANENKLRVVFRHFPLPVHKNSFKAAQAAEAAGKQGKFWEMSDRLFSTAEDWNKLEDPEAKFKEFAKDLGLNEEQFIGDYRSDPVRQAVQADLDSGNASQVQGTPTFFLNGFSITLPRSYQDFIKIIQNAGKQAESTPSAQIKGGSEEQKPADATPQPEGKQDDR